MEVVVVGFNNIGHILKRINKLGLNTLEITVATVSIAVSHEMIQFQSEHAEKLLDLSIADSSIIVPTASYHNANITIGEKVLFDDNNRVCYIKSTFRQNGRLTKYVLSYKDIR